MKQHRRAQRQRASEGRRLVITLRPGESLEHILTPEDRRLMHEAVDAEARGDAGAALEAHLSGLIVEESLTRYRLQEMATLGPEAPAWMCSRWAVDQAARWMLLTDDPRCDQIVRTILAALHMTELDALYEDPIGLTEYGTLVASCDWVYYQLAAYECGGLRDFLDVRAEPGLLEHLDEIDDWERAAVTSYELITTRDDVLEVRRFPDGQVVELLNLGATTEIGPGAMVVGRVVPISVWPFAMFESRPLPVDEMTADIVPESSHARPSGELSGRMVELMAAGLPGHVANGVCVAELALIIAKVSGDIGPVASHLIAVMVDPRVCDALKQHSARPGHGPLWRILAAGTPSPVRDRCLELATLVEARQAS